MLTPFTRLLLRYLLKTDKDLKRTTQSQRQEPTRVPLGFWTHRINVPMIARESLLLEEGACPLGHRGIWFYDPAVVGANIRPGDRVGFWCCDELILLTTVLAVVEPGSPSNRWCSALNHRGFRWCPLHPVERTPEDQARYEAHHLERAAAWVRTRWGL